MAILRHAFPPERNERDLFRFIDERVQSNWRCLDIGAHLGLVSERLLSAASDGLVFAFEPQPKSFEFVQKRLGGEPRLKLRAQAVGSCSAKRAFLAVDGLNDVTGYSGFYDSEEIRSTVQRIDPNTQFSWKEVEMVSLDSQADELFPIEFAKIDVEGAELEIFQGGIRLFSRSESIVIFEHQPMHAQIADPDANRKLYELINENGGQIYLISNFMKGCPPLEAAEFACLYFSRKENMFLAKFHACPNDQATQN